MSRSLGRTCAGCGERLDDEALRCDWCNAAQPVAGDPTVALVPLPALTLGDQASVVIERVSWSPAGRAMRSALLLLLCSFIVLVSLGVGLLAYSFCLLYLTFVLVSAGWATAVSGLVGVAAGSLTLYSMNANARLLDRARVLLGPNPADAIGPPMRVLSDGRRRARRGHRRPSTGP